MQKAERIFPWWRGTDVLTGQTSWTHNNDYAAVHWSGHSTPHSTGRTLHSWLHAIVGAFLMDCLSGSCSTCSPSVLIDLHILYHTHTHTKLLHSYFILFFSSIFSSPFQQSSPLPSLRKSLPSPRSPPPFAPSLYSHLPKHLAKQLISRPFCVTSPRALIYPNLNNCIIQSLVFVPHPATHSFPCSLSASSLFWTPKNPLCFLISTSLHI